MQIEIFNDYFFYFENLKLFLVESLYEIFYFNINIFPYYDVNNKSFDIVSIIIMLLEKEKYFDKKFYNYLYLIPIKYNRYIPPYKGGQKLYVPSF
jgi:hypothetical protein